jgi:hypothetical protein
MSYVTQKPDPVRRMALNQKYKLGNMTMRSSDFSMGYKYGANVRENLPVTTFIRELYTKTLSKHVQISVSLIF